MGTHGLRSKLHTMDSESMLLFTERPDPILLRIHRLPPVCTEYENVREQCAIQFFAILVGRNYRTIHNSEIDIQTHVEFVEFGAPIFRFRDERPSNRYAVASSGKGRQKRHERNPKHYQPFDFSKQMHHPRSYFCKRRQGLENVINRTLMRITT
jgi:hypothetical protein